MSEESFLSQVKRLLVGAPISSHLADHQRLSRFTGLAVLSSDALSSVAYATEAILFTLIVAGRSAFSYATPIALAIAVLLAVVAYSYRQTIYAYPSGGGAYIVARENLGQTAGLVAAASLLVDYTLTVAVSIAAGVAAITSALPAFHVNRVEMALFFLVIITVGNLRGIRESGRIFSVPTYFFVGGILLMLGLGLFRWATASVLPVHPADAMPGGSVQLTLFVFLTAFANGCTAMTGVEAVSNGVPAFRRPESRNAAWTLTAMAVLAITMFMGITLLAHVYSVVPSDTETVVSQIARGVFGGRRLPYYAIQIATMLILVLAANTAFAGFPRLASIVSRDRFLPRQFMNLGDRLAFSNGILALAVFAAFLIVVFGGNIQALLPLYMIGVFLSFTLSQAGMVLRWRRERSPGWRAKAMINGFGALVTGAVLVVVAITKSLEGAWIIILLIPLIVGVFRLTRNHYDAVADQLSLKDVEPRPQRTRSMVVVPISGVHRAVVQAVEYARTLSTDVRALYVNTNPLPTTVESLRKDWDCWGHDVPLVVLESEYRSLMEPLLEYLDTLAIENPDAFITVVLPEFVPAKLWHHLLHNQRALLLKAALHFRPNMVLTSVPFHFSR